jgi:hypothetical protein
MLLRSAPDPGLERLRATVVHLPELIGIREVLSVTIFRDPVKAICSNIFKYIGVFGMPESLKNMVKVEEDDYIKYIDMVKKTKSYSIDFTRLSADPVNEVKKFLVHHGINGYQNPSFEDIDSVFKKHKYENDLHNGHFPREAENDVQYNTVYSYLNSESAIVKAKGAYLEMIKEISNE